MLRLRSCRTKPISKDINFGDATERNTQSERERERNTLRVEVPANRSIWALRVETQKPRANRLKWVKAKRLPSQEVPQCHGFGSV